MQQGGCQYIKHSEYSVILHVYRPSWQVKRLIDLLGHLIEFLVVCADIRGKHRILLPDCAATLHIGVPFLPCQQHAR
jgi:hypothetical protein